MPKSFEPASLNCGTAGPVAEQDDALDRGYAADFIYRHGLPSPQQFPKPNLVRHDHAVSIFN